MGVWITCRSPAPNVIVLYRLKERRREKKDWKGNQRTNGVSQKIRPWRRGLISRACPESSVSQRQRHGESQKLSRYITSKTQAIPADQDMNGAGQDSMPTTLLQNNTSTTMSMSHYGREKSQHTWQVSCAGQFPLQLNVSNKGRGDWPGWICMIHLGPWSVSGIKWLQTLLCSDLQSVKKVESVFLKEVTTT